MEPFLENPPRRRRRKSARRRGKPRGHRRGCRCVVCARKGGTTRRRKTTTRRRHRSNPYATLYGGAMNPRRKRRRGARRTHRRRHYRRNPGGGVIGDLRSIIPAVGWGLAGYTGMNVLPAQLSKFVPMPKKEENAVMYYGVKILIGLGLGWAVGRFVNRQAGRHVLAGSVLTVGAEAVNQFALAPMGLSTYLPDSMGEEVETYLPGSQVGYLSPGVTVDDMGDEESVVTRLDPSRRF